MTEEDKKLMEKFEQIIAAKPSEDAVLDFWSKLSVEEYDRLIYLFEQNKPEDMSEEARTELIDIFKKLKEKILENQKAQ